MTAMTKFACSTVKTMTNYYVRLEHGACAVCTESDAQCFRLQWVQLYVVGKLMPG